MPVTHWLYHPAKHNDLPSVACFWGAALITEVWASAAWLPCLPVHAYK